MIKITSGHCLTIIQSYLWYLCIVDGKRLRQATVCPLQSSTEECMRDNENDGNDVGPHTDFKLEGGKPDPASKEAPGVSDSPFNFSIDWFKMLTSDCFHLREHR